MATRQSYKWRFIENILKLSPNASSIEEALKQWEVIYSRKGQGIDDCICTYKNITNLRFARNIITNDEIIVGSCCVQKFGIRNGERSIVRCRECHKHLTMNNKYLVSLYEAGIDVNNRLQIIGHDRCAALIKTRYRDILDTIQREPTTGSIRTSTQNMIKNFVNYFRGIITEMSVDSNNELTISTDARYEEYLEMLEII